MLLLLMREDKDQPPWRIIDLATREYRPSYTEISLVPLTAAESNALVSHLLTIDDFPASTRALILDRSEGNPFYLEQVIRSLIEQDAIARVDGVWRVRAPISTIQIPDTLQGVLLARIDRLQEDVRRTSSSRP